MNKSSPSSVIYQPYFSFLKLVNVQLQYGRVDMNQSPAQTFSGSCCASCHHHNVIVVLSVVHLLWCTRTEEWDKGLELGISPLLTCESELIATCTVGYALWSGLDSSFKSWAMRRVQSRLEWMTSALWDYWSEGLAHSRGPSISNFVSFGSRIWSMMERSFLSMFRQGSW